ncbi:MAG: hypothetical protein ACLP1X_08960 [Polyangiaceae bacterium]
MAYVALYGTVAGLLTAGMTEQARAVLAAAAPPRSGTVGQAWVDISYATVAWWQSGRLGEPLVRARRARDAALKGGDATGVAFADAYLWAAKASCISSEEGLAELNTVIKSHADSVPMLLGWFAIWRASIEARTDREEMSALRRRTLVPNVMGAEVARCCLRTELVRLNRIGKLEAELTAHTPVLAFACTNASVCRAFVALWRGEPGRALRELAEAEDLARVGAIYWTWELLHACRASALLALGRRTEAAESVRAGLARLAYTLEGIDDDLRAGAELHVDAVKRLRALAKELNMTDAS